MERSLTLESYIKQTSRRKSLLKKYGVVILFLLPFFVAFITFFILPLFYGIHISLTNFQYGAPGVETYNSFRWYKMIFDPNFQPKIYHNFWAAFLHSFIFSVIMVPIAIILPLTLAILVNMKPVGFKVFRALIYMPSIVPLTAAGTIFNLLFMSASQHGLLAEWFGWDIQWFIDIWFEFYIGDYLVQVPYAWIPIFLMCLWGGWGGNFIILSAGLQNVPRSLYEAASIDGASGWKKVTNVTIPGIRGQLILCLFTTIIGYLGLYGQNYVLSSGGPMIAKYQSLPAGGLTSTAIYFIQDIVANNRDFRAKLYGLGAAASLVFALFVGIISGLQMYVTRTRKGNNKYSEMYRVWQQIK